ncbi:hypothetical protein ACP70R_021277 [Stipagrostis hirtigluma subsp. patula]
MSFAGVSVVGDDDTPRRSAAETIAVTYSGYHLLLVRGYSRTKEDIRTGECIESRQFRVGGHRWVIVFYPNDYDPENAGDMSFHLVLDESNTVEPVKVQYEFTFGDRAKLHDSAGLVNAFGNQKFSSRHAWSSRCFMRRETFEKSRHLKNDSFSIKCYIDITKDVNIWDASATEPFVKVPPIDIHQHLGSLLQSNEGTDVTFEVGGETFAAHRCVLVARSAVFKAEISGPLMEGTTTSVIRVVDIEARVFKLLLSFVYTDMVPEIEKKEDEDVVWQHLLVAAERYDLLRLRLICEQKLCTYINTSTIAAILALAEEHHCRGLKEACLDFLKSPANLQEVMVIGGLDQLTSSCPPSVLKEVIAKLLAHNFVANTGDAGAAALPFVVVPESDMNKHFTDLLQSGESADVTFQVGDQMLAAHRCVLAARSAVFRAELFGSMMEGATNSVIRVDDMEPQVFKLLLSFIYSDSVPEIEEESEEKDEDDEIEETSKEEEEDDGADIMWRHLLMAADRYDVQRLRLMCEEKLCGYINASTVATILALAEQHHCQGLKEACLDFLDSPANLQEVMEASGLDHLRSTCPSVLIDVIAKLACIPQVW